MRNEQEKIGWLKDGSRRATGGNEISKRLKILCKRIRDWMVACADLSGGDMGGVVYDSSTMGLL